MEKMGQPEAKRRRLHTGKPHSSRQLGPASSSRPPEDATTSTAIQRRILSLIQHPALTPVQIAQITVGVWRRHALHLESQGAPIENKIVAQKIEENLEKVVSLISEIEEVIPLQPVGPTEAETQQPRHANPPVSQRKNSVLATTSTSHIPADDISDVSKSFEAQLGSLMDLHQPPAPAEKTGDDAQPQQPPSEIIQPVSHESLSSVQHP
ncbi:hypothetical protein F4821DRAFT_41896 [Hypoxylon rubiginosum]|uniref:Uncharacterized protein n=1 Tax=Hypoxylon rubiginosum TaxID=110542 RepID=A0ACC0CKN5_9PEZI|nr:hypothetical protein F4821DRAFT_41896 [Hypoxylon rubiginosum]